MVDFRGQRAGPGGPQVRPPQLFGRRLVEEVDRETRTSFKFGSASAPRPIDGAAGNSIDRDFLGGGKGNTQPGQSQGNARPEQRSSTGAMRPPPFVPEFSKLSTWKKDAAAHSQSNRAKQPESHGHSNDIYTSQAQSAREIVDAGRTPNAARDSSEIATGRSSQSQSHDKRVSSDTFSSSRNGPYQTAQHGQRSSATVVEEHRSHDKDQVRAPPVATSGPVKRKQVVATNDDEFETPASKKVHTSQLRQVHQGRHVEHSLQLHRERQVDQANQAHQARQGNHARQENQARAGNQANQQNHAPQVFEADQVDIEDHIQLQEEIDAPMSVESVEEEREEESPQFESGQRESTPTKGEISIGEEICKIIARTSLTSPSEDQGLLREMLDMLFAWFGRSTVQKAKIEEQAAKIEELLKLKGQTDDRVEALRGNILELKSLFKEKSDDAEKILYMWNNHKEAYQKTVRDFNSKTTGVLDGLKPFIKFVKDTKEGPEALQERVTYLKTQLHELKQADIDVTAAQGAAKEAVAKALDLQLLSTEQKTIIVGLEDKLKDKESHVLKLQEEKTTASQRADEATAEIKKLEKELSEVKVTFTGEKAALEERLKGEEIRREDIEARLAKAEEDVAKYKRENNILRAAHNKVVQEKKDFERDTMDKEAALLLEWQGKTTALERQVEDASNTLKNVQQELTQVNTEFEELEKKSSEALEIEVYKGQNLTVKVEELEATLQQKDNLLEERCVEISQRVGLLEAEVIKVQDLEEKLKASQTVLEQEKENFDEVTKICELLKAEKDKQEVHCKDMMAKLNAAIAEKDAELLAAVNAKEVLEETVSSHASAMKKLQEDLKGKIHLFQTASKELSQLDAIRTNLDGQIETLQNEVAARDVLLEERNVNLKALQKSLNKANAEKGEEAKRLSKLAQRYADDQLDVEEKTVVEAIVAQVEVIHQVALKKKDETIARLNEQIAQQEEESQLKFARELEEDIQEDDQSTTTSKKGKGRIASKGSKGSTASKSSKGSSRGGKNKPKEDFGGAFDPPEDETEPNKETGGSTE